MKTHIPGSNSRTFCGHKVTDNMKVLAINEEKYMSDCTTCLDRLKNSRYYLLFCFEELRNLKLKSRAFEQRLMTLK